MSNKQNNSQRKKDRPADWKNYFGNAKLSEDAKSYVSGRSDLKEEESKEAKVAYKSGGSRSKNKKSKEDFHLSTDKDGHGAHWTSTKEDKSVGFSSRTIEKGRDDNGRGWALDVQDRHHYGSSDSSHKQQRLLEQVQSEVTPSTSSGKQRQTDETRTSVSERELKAQIESQNISTKMNYYNRTGGWKG